MFIPPANTPLATAPRLLAGPRNVTAATGVPAIREKVFDEARRQLVLDQSEAPATDAAVRLGGEPTALGQAAVAPATYAYLSDAQGRLYLVNASAIGGLGAAPTPDSTEEAALPPASAYAAWALSSYASAATGFLGSPARLSVYV